MQLIMYVDGKPMDSIPVSIDELQSIGHFEMLKIKLEEKNEDIINLSQHEPQFFIDTLPSRMNHSEKEVFIN
jgi:hypothetical protein